MNVSSNVLEQFGLKVDDTNQMLTNTDRVTSVLFQQIKHQPDSVI